jgi:hypothetical protein
MGVYHGALNHLQAQVGSKLQSGRIAADQEFSAFGQFLQKLIWDFGCNQRIEFMPELKNLLRNQFFSHVLKLNDTFDQQNQAVTEEWSCDPHKSIVRRFRRVAQEQSVILIDSFNEFCAFLDQSMMIGINSCHENQILKVPFSQTANYVW